MNDTGWIDLPTLDARFGGRRPLILKLMTVFVSTYDGFAEKIGALSQADDSKPFLMELHSLKGAAASLGSERLRVRVAELETSVREGQHPPGVVAQEIVSFWPHVMQNAHHILTELR
jgi:HPt (histidine-containing phosphotransfer) domain-containing protein